ncbi:hypothetical protein K503DRAFT_853104 [Rhizopogon vinicolor AM-OR11-026]|uniref:RING-type domain-containing protein n=1 Tax=Rhizopogon vinicolor AM-OR11-026 TaxID=1314800 RepID=A0A1B7NFR5_9AGAM|nr:hypothetical protein K503DRAFT_853104 [Rhizopogon vinicolor AM-OR11-026]
MPSLAYPAMSEHSGTIQRVKRPTSDVETEPTPSSSKRLRVDQSPETSSRRDQKKRKKRRKKAPVITKLDGSHHTRDSSSQHQRPPVSARNEIIRFTSVELSGSKTSAEVLSCSATVIPNPTSYESDTEKDSKDNSQPGNSEGKVVAETMELGYMQQPQGLSLLQLPLGVPDDRVSQLTRELAERGEILATHQNVLNNISQALTCQICLDIMYKPFALAPCGHVACYDCLVQWFNAPLADNQPAPPAIVRKKTCPHCRAVVRDRPAEIWTIKNLAHIIEKSGLLSMPSHDKAEGNADRPADADPWDGIFRKSGHGFLPWLFADEPDPEPRRGEDVGMLDMEDGGIYRCLDCMHEIWDGMCTACGRRYLGHWSDDELDLDFASGVEEFDPEDDPGWMGLEDGEGDGEDDSLAIADWYPGLPFSRWRFGFDGDDEEDEASDGDEGDLEEDAAYESSFIDDENDTGILRGAMQQPPQIYELSDDSDNDDSRSHVDVDTSEEEDEPSLTSRRGRTAPIIVSSGEEDEDNLDSVPAIRPMLSRTRRGRLVESDDELLGSSDRSSHS